MNKLQELIVQISRLILLSKLEKNITDYEKKVSEGGHASIYAEFLNQTKQKKQLLLSITTNENLESLVALLVSLGQHLLLNNSDLESLYENSKDRLDLLFKEANCIEEDTSAEETQKIALLFITAVYAICFSVPQSFDKLSLLKQMLDSAGTQKEKIETLTLLNALIIDGKCILDKTLLKEYAELGSLEKQRDFINRVNGYIPLLPEDDRKNTYCLKKIAAGFLKPKSPKNLGGFIDELKAEQKQETDSQKQLPRKANKIYDDLGDPDIIQTVHFLQENQISEPILKRFFFLFHAPNFTFTRKRLIDLLSAISENKIDEKMNILCIESILSSLMVRTPGKLNDTLLLFFFPHIKTYLNKNPNLDIEKLHQDFTNFFMMLPSMGMDVESIFSKDENIIENIQNAMEDYKTLKNDNKAIMNYLEKSDLNTPQKIILREILFQRKMIPANFKENRRDEAIYSASIDFDKQNKILFPLALDLFKLGEGEKSLDEQKELEKKANKQIRNERIKKAISTSAALVLLPFRISASIVFLIVSAILFLPFKLFKRRVPFKKINKFIDKFFYAFQLTSVFHRNEASFVNQQIKQKIKVNQAQEKQKNIAPKVRPEIVDQVQTDNPNTQKDPSYTPLFQNNKPKTEEEIEAPSSETKPPVN